MSPNGSEAVAGNCIVITDTKAYNEDTLVASGILKPGAVIHITKERFRGRTLFSLVSGEGPSMGWVYYGGLQWEEE